MFIFFKPINGIMLDIDPFLDEAAKITNDYIRLDKVAQRIEQSNNSD